MKLFLLFIPLIVLSCNSSSEDDEEIETEPWVYNFIVGGHVYGHADRYTESVYPNFLKQLDSIIPITQPSWIFLTGDVVAHPTPENWETVKSEMDARGVEWVIAPGNHDISFYMDTVVQPFKYKAIKENGNLILTLNTSHPGWCPDSLQRVFIKENLQELDSVNNIFVLSHQLWWQKDRPVEFDLDSVHTNSYAGFESENNFWDKVFTPYFSNLEQDVYFIAGDLGSHEIIASYYEDHYKNFHFYGSGMGGGLEDNYLHVKTYEDGTVEVNRVNF